MPALDLDFLRTRPASPWVRWVLLAIALGFVADIGFAYHRVQSRMADNEGALAHVQRVAENTADVPAKRRAPTADDIRVARETMQRLTMPWDALFRALETAASEKVALLAIEPDARSGTVVISGEAADYRAVLDYVSLLGRSDTLKRPHLVRHEEVENASPKTVRFSVSAAWSSER